MRIIPTAEERANASDTEHQTSSLFSVESAHSFELFPEEKAFDAATGRVDSAPVGLGVSAADRATACTTSGGGGAHGTDDRPTGVRDATGGAPISLFLARRLDAAAALLAAVAARLRRQSARAVRQPTRAVRPRVGWPHVAWPRTSVSAGWRVTLRRPMVYLSIGLALSAVLVAALAGALLAARPLPVSGASLPQARAFVTLPAGVSQNPPEVAPLPPARGADTRDIQRVLNRYRDAFSVLDVSAVTAIWPSADASLLATTFVRLAAQNYEYDWCNITADGLRGEAHCRGIAEYRPVGRSNTRTDARSWHFTLIKVNEEWRIETAITESDAPVMTSSRARP